MTASLVNEQAIFEAARALPLGDARRAYLQEACRDDAALQNRVQALLAAYDDSESFLESPLHSLRPTPRADLPLAEQPGAMIGPYKLLEIIGEGGMGIVYRAEQKQPVDRVVALKIIKPGLDTRQVISRFEAERQALALMDHPNIAKVLDAGTTGETKDEGGRLKAENSASSFSPHPSPFAAGRPYFVMELVQGIPITKFCDQQHLNVRQRLELMIPVCQAIQHAHQKGIIHRDIKPSNVLVTQYDGHPVPKVIDFGVAKAIQAHDTSAESAYWTNTHLGQIIGTLEYMSPEQAELNPRDIDTRSDIYSLGVLIYELLTGVTPFDQQHFRDAAFHEMLRIIREEEPQRPSARLSSPHRGTREVGRRDVARQRDVAPRRTTAIHTDTSSDGGHSPPYSSLASIAALRSIEPARLSHSLRGELDWIVMKALEKDRSRRYDSASSLALDLQRYLVNEPVLAGPPSRLYRFRKFLRRNAGFITATILVSVALASLAGTVAVQSLKRAAFRQQTAQQIDSALSAARSAVDASNLMLAELHLAEARGRLGDQASFLADHEAAISRLATEVAARRADDERLAKFIQLAREASDNMSFSSQREGHLSAKQALEIFGILSNKNWLERLDRSYLTTEQKSQIRETAYQTLVTLADYGVRWRHQWIPRGEELAVTNLEGLDLLDTAESFHEPTRALWFVRRSAYRQLKDEIKAEECDRRFRTAEAKNAWDYYLPGHTAGWEGKYTEAIEGYQAALRIQPDHYNSLFFLADRLAWAPVKRGAESIQLYTACIALRPHHLYAYQSRGKLFENRKQLADAEADYSAAIAAMETDYDRFFAYHYRREFYVRTNATELAAADSRSQIDVGEKFLRSEAGQLGSEHPKVMRVQSWLAKLQNEQQRFTDAISNYEQVLKWRQTHLGLSHATTLGTMKSLEAAYRRENRLAEANSLQKQHATLVEKIELQKLASDSAAAQEKALIAKCTEVSPRLTDEVAALLNSVPAGGRSSVLQPLCRMATLHNLENLATLDSPSDVRRGLLLLFDDYLAEEGRSAAAYQKVEDALAELKEFERARQHLEADTAAISGQYGALFRLLLLDADQNQTAAYRRHAAELIARLDTATKGAGSEWLRHALLASGLLPGALENYDSAISLARRHLAGSPKSGLRSAALGALLLRAGRAEEAIEVLQLATTTKIEVDGANVYGQYLLAMAWHRLNQPDKAKAALRTANSLGTPYYNWRFTMIVKLLRQEATQLVGSATQASAEKSTNRGD